MGLQVPRSLRAQTASEGHFWAGAPAAGCDLPRTGSAKGMPDYRGPSDAGPCAYVHRHSPKHPVASVIGFLKGKSAIAIARLSGKERNFTGEHFWARGYAVSTVGFELETGPSVHPPARDGGWS